MGTRDYGLKHLLRFYKVGVCVGGRWVVINVGPFFRMTSP